VPRQGRERVTLDIPLVNPSTIPLSRRCATPSVSSRSSLPAVETAAKLRPAPSAGPSRGEGANLLPLADTCLLWGHRLSEWCGHGPQLEEDIALTNTALDVIGQARSLYRLHAARANDGSTEDSLAYFRNAHEFQNIPLAEAENGDYAQTILRSLMLSAWFVPLWNQLSECDDIELAAFAREAAKASRVQLRHASEWTIRFGDGTVESHRRIELAIATLSPYVHSLLETEVHDTDRGDRVAQWRKTIDAVTSEATLSSLPDAKPSELDRSPRERLLAEMQSLAREHPGASW
jgi:ring-1,2-phenylacetyl-CoA epoxidase subunit PaaC